MAPPTVFISYSWDSPDHQNWVERLASNLRAQGIDAKLDKWEVEPGDFLTHFMERGVSDSEFVASICTPRYKAKFDGRFDGTGYEAQLITGAGLTERKRGRLIPVLRSGNIVDAIPAFFLGAYFIDLTNDAEAEFEKLRGKVLGTLKKAPPLGASPTVPGTFPDEDYSNEVPLRAELFVAQHGLAVRVHNEDLSPHSDCEVAVIGVNRFSEKLNAFTKNPTEPFRILRAKEILGDGTSSGHIFGPFSSPPVRAVNLAPYGREPYRRADFPSIDKAGVWKIDLSVKSSNSAATLQKFYLNWVQGGPLTLLQRPGEHTALPSDAVATEDRPDRPHVDSVNSREWRRQIVTGSRIRLSPVFPVKCQSDDLIVREVTDDLLTLNRIVSGHELYVPWSRIVDVFQTSPSDPLAVELNGRMQWISTNRTWKFFREKPGSADERKFGFDKPSSIADPAAAAIIRKLDERGTRSRFSTITKAAELFTAGWQLVYDEDGKYFRVHDRSGDDLVLIASAP